MRRVSRTGMTAILGAMALCAAVLVGADGCAGNERADPTPVRTFKITPAANAGTAVASRTVVPETPTPPARPPGAGEPIVIAGIGSEFNVEEVSAPAGTITVQFDNRDGGVIHNIHFFKGSDNDGESVAETELEAGPIDQTVTFDAEPGEYFYQCDAHPTTMEGILTVE